MRIISDTQLTYLRMIVDAARDIAEDAATADCGPDHDCCTVDSSLIENLQDALAAYDLTLDSRALHRE